MKKIFTLFLFVFSMSLTSFGQIADGSTAPDFTITDVNGVEHNLYQYLDEGKTVILDLFAVWCGPCWNYHQGGSLKDLHKVLGPDALDNTVIIAIEADPSTAAETIYGGGNSIGDWVDGTTYTMANDDTIADAYELAYYPTIYKVCPGDKTVYEIGQLSYDALLPNIFTAECMPPVSTTDVASLGYKGSTQFCAGEMSFDVVNMGTEAITSMMVEATDANGDILTSQEWTGDLTSYGIMSVSAGELMIDDATDVNFSVTAMGDEVEGNNAGSVSLGKAPYVEDYRMTVEVMTDNYGDETYWAFTDAAGNIVAEGGNPNVGFINAGAGYPDAHPDMYASNTMYTTEVSLPNPGDCYDFVMADGYGDGMCCAYGNGSYRVMDSSGNVLFEGAEFQALDNNPFEKAETVSNNEVVIANEINMFPNPATDVLNVRFSLEETTSLNVTIFNTVGQTVKTLGLATYNTGLNTMTINTADLSTGMYMLTIQSNEGTTSQKFTVSK